MSDKIKSFELFFYTLEKSFYSGAEVVRLTLPGELGEMTVLPGHAPALTTIKAGILTVETLTETKSFAISWGFCEVLPTAVRVLAETAEAADEISLERAQAAYEKALEALKSKSYNDEKQLTKYQLKAERARIRQQVAGH